MSILSFFSIGLVAGVFSGLLGIGGATIMIPMLVYFWGASQHLAQGTTLAVMVLPIGLLAAYRYYISGNVDLSVVLFVAVGFFIGGFFGATIAQPMADHLLRRLFGAFLLLVSLRMIIF